MGKQYNKLSNLTAALSAHSIMQSIVHTHSCEHHIAIQLLAENVEDFEAKPTSFLEVHYIFNGLDRVAHFFEETDIVMVFHVDDYWFHEHDDGNEESVYEIEGLRLFKTARFFQMLQSTLNEYDYAVMRDPSFTHGRELLNEFAAGDTPTAQ